MKLIKNAEFGGERPLFESHDLRLENVYEVSTLQEFILQW